MSADDNPSICCDCAQDGLNNILVGCAQLNGVHSLPSSAVVCRHLARSALAWQMALFLSSFCGRQSLELCSASCTCPYSTPVIVAHESEPYWLPIICAATLKEA